MDDRGLNATLVGRIDLNTDVAIFHVRPDEAPVAPFLPGQFVRIGLPAAEPDPSGRVRIQKRAYSIASSPERTDALELLIARVPDGALTSRLWETPLGARCYVDPRAAGRFTLEDVPRDKDLVFVATGTGVAPYVSMLRASDAVEPPWRAFALFHGARTQSDLAYRAEIELRERASPRFRYAPVLSREPEGTGWSGARGRVQSLFDRFRDVAGFELDPSSCEVLLCGNPEMIASLRPRLGALGFTADHARTRGNVHFESYW